MEAKVSGGSMTAVARESSKSESAGQVGSASAGSDCLRNRVVALAMGSRLDLMEAEAIARLAHVSRDLRDQVLADAGQEALYRRVRGPYASTSRNPSSAGAWKLFACSHRWTSRLVGDRFPLVDLAKVVSPAKPCSAYLRDNDKRFSFCCDEGAVLVQDASLAPCLYRLTDDALLSNPVVFPASDKNCFSSEMSKNDAKKAITTHVPGDFLEPHEVRLWSLDDGDVRCVQRVQPSLKRVQYATESRDGRIVLFQDRECGCWEGSSKLTLLDARDGSEQRLGGYRANVPNWVEQRVLCRADIFVAAIADIIGTERANRLCVWDLRRPSEPLTTIQEPRGRIISDFDFTPSGRELVYVDHDGGVGQKDLAQPAGVSTRLCDGTDGRRPAGLSFRNRLCCHPNGEHALLWSGLGDHLHLVDLFRRESSSQGSAWWKNLADEICSEARTIDDLAISPTGRYFGLVPSSGPARLYDLLRDTTVSTATEHHVSLAQGCTSVPQQFFSGTRSEPTTLYRFLEDTAVATAMG